MITGLTLLTRVRLELNDPLVEGEEPKWPTAELMTYANDGVRDYSKHFQRQTRLTVAGEAAVRGDDGTWLLPMPIAVFRIVSVHYQRDGQARYLPDATGVVAGARIAAYTLTTGETTSDDAIGLRLNFAPAAGTDLAVDYLVVHDLFDPADLDVATTVPDEDEELLSLYTTAKAWNRVGGQDAALSRWDETGRRNDSPIIPREQRLFAAYRLKLNQKLAMPRALRLRRV